MNGTSPQAAPKRRLWLPLRHRDFRLMWSGQTISLIGDQCYFVALPWLVLQLTGSGLALGTVLMTAAIPRAVLMLLGGAVSDRFPPRWVMFWSNVFRALVVAVVAALTMLRVLRLWHIYVLAFLFGLVEAFFFPAFIAIIAQLVSKEELEPANALAQGSAQVTALAGPAPAGILIARAGTAIAFFADALSFVVAAISLCMMKGNNQPPPAAFSSPKPDLLTGIREGLTYAWKDPLIRAVVLISAALNLTFTGPFQVGAPALAHSRFPQGAVALGAMLSALGGGALLGMFIAGSARRQIHRGRLILLLSASIAVGSMLLAIVPNVWLAVAIITPIGIGAGITNVLVVAWMQSRAEPAMLGRVMSLMMFGAVGLQPFSFALAGALAAWNLKMMWILAALTSLVATVIAASSRTVRQME